MIKLVNNFVNFYIGNFVNFFIDINNESAVGVESVILLSDVVSVLLLDKGLWMIVSVEGWCYKDYGYMRGSFLLNRLGLAW